MVIEMYKFARIVNNIVIETINAEVNDLSDILHPDLAADFYPCSVDVLPGWVYDGEDFSPPPPPPPPSQAQLIQRAAEIRHARENGGVLVEVDGQTYTLRTDQESLSKLGNIFTTIRAGLRTDGAMFKFVEGFAPVTNDQMDYCCMIALNHVQVCFDCEADVNMKILSGEITTFEQINSYNWPGV